MRLGQGSLSTLQEALDTAQDGDTVWIGPGTLTESELTFAGKSIRLRATEVGRADIVAGKDSLSVGFRFESGESADALLDGLEVTAASSAVRIVNAHPAIRNCTFYESNRGIYLEGSRSTLSRNILTDNWPYAGLEAVSSAPTVTACEITANSASWQGGGMVVKSSSPLITRCVIRDNLVYGGWGAGAYVRDSALLVHRSRVEGNCACAEGYDDAETTGHGAGIYLEASSASLVDCSISENEVEWATGTSTSGRGLGGGIVAETSGLAISGCVFDHNIAGSGGAIHLSDSSLSIRNSAIRGNESTPYSSYNDYGSAYYAFSGAGAGIFASSSFAVIENTLLTDNTAAEGGAIALTDGSAASLKFVDIISNRAETYWTYCGGLYSTCESVPYGGQPGGIWLDMSRATIADSILAYNEDGNLLGGAAAELSFSNLYNPPDWVNVDVAIEGTNLSLEPEFLRYLDSQGTGCEAGSSAKCLPSDLHLGLGSPLIDTGEPGLMDVDGTRADPGMYGGSAGDIRDLDRDGFPDWFWPGTIEDAPEGFDPTDFDTDDSDPAIHP